VRIRGQLPANRGRSVQWPSFPAWDNPEDWLSFPPLAVLVLLNQRLFLYLLAECSMRESAGHEITELLQAWRQGDEHALEKLTPRVYRELDRAAKLCMKRGRDGHSMQTTGLINELYLRLTELKGVEWQSRAHLRSAV
jgi:hypothetical protein